jgi:lipid II:glycine glycyltransferase (peptidoglycan interpeptide bridge formation enzyme)
MGDQLKIWVASSHGIPVASILTLRFKSTLTYKYGCADERFFRLGGMQMLLWRAMQEAKESCLKEFDLGRSEANDEGLIVFKDRLGAARTTLTYFRHPVGSHHASFAARRSQQGRRMLAYMPASLLSKGGKLLYRHFG